MSWTRTARCRSSGGTNQSEAAPLAAVAFDEGIRPGRAPGAGWIEMDVIRALAPALEDVLGPAPRLLDLVGAREQGAIAEHGVQQQALVGVCLVHGIGTEGRAIE